MNGSNRRFVALIGIYIAGGLWAREASAQGIEEIQRMMRSSVRQTRDACDSLNETGRAVNDSLDDLRAVQSSQLPARLQIALDKYRSALKRAHDYLGGFSNDTHWQCSTKVTSMDVKADQFRNCFSVTLADAQEQAGCGQRNLSSFAKLEQEVVSFVQGAAPLLANVQQTEDEFLRERDRAASTPEEMGDRPEMQDGGASVGTSRSSTPRIGFLAPGQYE